MQSSHSLSTIFAFDQATPLLIFSFAFCVIIFMRVFIFEKLQDWGYTISSNEIKVDEDLPNFF